MSPNPRMVSCSSGRSATVTPIWRDSPPRRISTATSLPDGTAFQGELDIVGILHGFTVQLDQDIADEDTRFCCRSLGFEREYDQAFVMIGEFDRLQADAEIAARDVFPRQDFVHHTVECHCRDGESRDARERAGGDPDGFALASTTACNLLR